MKMNLTEATAKALQGEITDGNLDSIFSKYAGYPVKVSNFKEAHTNMDSKRTPTYAYDFSATVTGDNFKIKIRNALKLNTYTIFADNDEDGDIAEKVATKINIKAVDIMKEAGLYNQYFNNL